VLKKCSGCGLNFDRMNQSQIQGHLDWCDFDNDNEKQSKKKKDIARQRNNRRREKNYEDFD